MNNKMSKKWIVIFILSLLPIVITAVMYKSLPQQVPMHWGINGEVNRYGDKSEMWFVAALSPFLAVLFYFLPKIDPRKKNYAKFQNIYEGFAVVMILFLTGIQAVVISESIHPGTIAIGNVVVISVGLLFAVMGNFMPKVKSNFFIGIRTPWTLSSPEVWNKTHRLAGQLWAAGGLAIMASGFIKNGMAMFVLLMIITVIITIVPMLMSYIWYEQEKKNIMP